MASDSQYVDNKKRYVKNTVHRSLKRRGIQGLDWQKD
jgi:hypothetical protein